MSITERTFSLGLWSWLAIVEKESGRLSEGAQNALGLLREDLEKLAEPSTQGAVKALEEIANADPVDMALDPSWAARVASAALASLNPESRREAVGE